MPYINIPVLYIFPANHTEPINVNISVTIERINSQVSYRSIATLTGIIIGEVKGITESQKANAPSGFLIMPCAAINAMIKGTVTGNINCCVSVSLSTAEPIAANNDAYNK